MRPAGREFDMLALKAPMASTVPLFSPDLVHFQPEESPLLFSHLQVGLLIC